MKILLTGAKGLFGVNFLNNFSTKHRILATYHQNNHTINFENTKFVKLDIKDTALLQKLISRYAPDVVIHGASLGDVDYCQNNKRKAYQVNVEATANIARVCKKQRIKLIYFSSNAIYNGNKPPYSENSAPNPINYYGYTKLAGEQKIKLENPDFIILRLITMYGWNEKSERQNPATWIIEKLKNEKKIKMVDDVYNNHLYVVSATSIVNKLLNKWASGETFNIAGADCLNRFEFATEIAKVFKFGSDGIEHVKNDFFKQIAPRPKNTCFRTDKIKRYLGCKIWSTHEGLSHMQKNYPSFS